MKKIKIIFFVVASFIILASLSYALNLPKWFLFNRENALDEWQEKIFKDRVLYFVEPEKEGGYLIAKSNRACSGLLYKIKFYPKNFPMIGWRWKIIKFPEKAKPDGIESSWLEKDDYAARVYIIFPSWNFMNIECIEYVWDKNLKEGTIITSPFWHNIKIIIAESGKSKKDEWVSEEHNIYEDYKKAFGKAPGGYVGAVALMTDSDNTFSSAEALYTDIRVGYKK